MTRQGHVPHAQVICQVGQYEMSEIPPISEEEESPNPNGVERGAEEERELATITFHVAAMINWRCRRRANQEQPQSGADYTQYDF